MTEIAHTECALRIRIRIAAEDLQRAQREMRGRNDVGPKTGCPSPLLVGAVEALLLAADSLIGECQGATC